MKTKQKTQTNKQPITYMFSYELELYNKGTNIVAGVDEVGRGPLAGPMVVAAVIFNKNDIQELQNNYNENSPFVQIKDSKQLSAKKREELSIFIKNVAFKYSIETLEHTLIDNKGISQATQIGFFNSVKALGYAEHILTDNFNINAMPQNIQTNIVKGDSKSISIAAASIIAKVYRDNIMREYAQEYTTYGFEKHKGYGTKSHREAILEFGPCKIHRKSFEPIKSMIRK